MAPLSDQDRKELWEKYMEDASGVWEGLNLSKAELRAAVDATDQWIDDNQASFNDALPLPARNVLSIKQKARLFMEVTKKRYEVE